MAVHRRRRAPTSQASGAAVGAGGRGSSRDDSSSDRVGGATVPRRKAACVVGTGVARVGKALGAPPSPTGNPCPLDWPAPVNRSERYCQSPRFGNTVSQRLTIKNTFTGNRCARIPFCNPVHGWARPAWPTKCSNENMAIVWPSPALGRSCVTRLVFALLVAGIFWSESIYAQGQPFPFRHRERPPDCESHLASEQTDGERHGDAGG